MKPYRQDSHTVSLIFWALLCIAVAIVLFGHSATIVNRALRAEEIAAGVGFLMFGPAALTLYLVRARHVWVGVDPERGIVVSGKHVIPWPAIERIERRTPRLRNKSGPAEIPSMKEVGDGCGMVGCVDAPGCAAGVGEVFAVAAILFAVLFVFWLIFFVFLPLIILPVLEVFAPFGDRITIHAGGKKLVLRDLRDADDFVRAVGRHARVVVR